MSFVSDSAINSRIQFWADNATDERLGAEFEQLVAAGDESALIDAFYQDLSFGTAGLRGILGPGTNRMNLYTVGKATQGLADYLNRHFDAPSVAIARDSRLMGEEFMKHVSCVLAANGVRVFVFERIEPTPLLSFAVRHLNTSAGICLTASHNPRQYQGYKAYGADGCQITSDQAQEISDAISEVNPFRDVLTCNFDDCIDNGMVSWISDETIEAYLDAVEQASLYTGSLADISVVYTPLHGTGLECIEKLFERKGISQVTLVESQITPDGNFPTAPYPNPEERAALTEGIRVCEKVHPDILIATDPDADRVGIAVEHEGAVELITGNEVGILLMDFLCRMRQEQGLITPDAEVISTIVSTTMIDKLAEHYGVHITRTLTGFKYIGSRMNALEESGRGSDFILGFEESYGYVSGMHVRDKDAVVATLLLCEMTAYWKSQGKDLVSALNSLYEEYGYYLNKTLSFTFEGASGHARMQSILAQMRAVSPVEIGGFSLESKVDYSGGVGELPPANVIEFGLASDQKVIIRPSGTEPKIKAYIFSTGVTRKEAQRNQARIEVTIQEMFA